MLLFTGCIILLGFQPSYDYDMIDYFSELAFLENGKSLTMLLYTLSYKPIKRLYILYYFKFKVNVSNMHIFFTLNLRRSYCRLMGDKFV